MREKERERTAMNEMRKGTSITTSEPHSFIRQTSTLHKFETCLLLYRYE